MSGNNGNNRDPNNGSGLKKYFNIAAGGLIALAAYSMMFGGQDTETSSSPYTDGSSYADSYNNAGNTDPRAQSQQDPIRLDSRFWDDANHNNLSNVVVTNLGHGMVVTGHHRTEQRNFVFTTKDDKRLYDTLEANNIRYVEELKTPQQNSGNNNNDDSGGIGLMGILSLAFMGFIVWSFISMRKGMGGGGGGLGNVGGNKAKLLTEHGGRVTFDDVAGVDDAKEELEEVVDFLRNPTKYSRLGARIPTGALLVGPPGTGKTLMARAVAGEANVPFYSISGSDFVQMFVGVGASRVREMFKEARKNAPCIIFIDEIDAVAKKRGGNAMGGGNDEREQTLNQLLVEMDGFETDDGIIIMGATNRAEMLDDAILRPGRFDRQVQVGNPVLEGREQILKVHARKVPCAEDIDLRKIARGTPGFSGAMLANLINEAAIGAAREGETRVYMRHMEEAKDKVMMGRRSKYNILSPEEKLKTAEHEVGHALVGLRTSPMSDPLYKITAIPRGGSLGVTINIPEKDQVSISEGKIKAKLAMIFGGRKAEELIYGKDNITTGAENDIQQATNYARAMVTRWGYSDKLGRVRYDNQQTDPFGGGGGYMNNELSEHTKQLIEEEVRRFVKEAEEEAHRILEDGMDDLRLVADMLNTHEELSGDEVAYILEHRAMPPQPEPEPEPHISELEQPEMPSVEELEDRLIDLSDHKEGDEQEDKQQNTEPANDNADETEASNDNIGDDRPKLSGIPPIPRKPRGP